MKQQTLDKLWCCVIGGFFGEAVGMVLGRVFLSIGLMWALLAAGLVIGLSYGMRKNAADTFTNSTQKITNTAQKIYGGIHWRSTVFFVIGAAVFTFISYRLCLLRSEFPSMLSQSVKFIPPQFNEPVAILMLIVIWFVLITAVLSIELVITGKQFHSFSFAWMFWWSVLFITGITLLLFCETVLNGNTPLSQFVSALPKPEMVRFIITQCIYWGTAYAMLGITYLNCQNGIERDTRNRYFPPLTLTVCVLGLIFIFLYDAKFAGYLPDALCLTAVLACFGLITKKRNWLLIPFCALLVGIMNLTATTGFSEMLSVGATLFIVSFLVIENKGIVPLLLTAGLSFVVVFLCQHLRSYNSPEIPTLLAVWCAACLWRMLDIRKYEEQKPEKETAPQPAVVQAKPVFYFYVNNKKYGPTTPEQLQQLAAAGKITSETVIENTAGQRTNAGTIQWLTFPSNPPPVQVPKSVPVPNPNVPKQQ
jgi:MFS family permease